MNFGICIPKGFSKVPVVSRLSPQSQSEEGLSDGQHNTTDLVSKLKLLSNACKDLLFHNVRFMVEESHMIRKNTYCIEPKLVNSFTHLFGSLELDAEFASVFINGIFPLWSNTLLENKAVGTNIQTGNFDDIAPGASSKMSQYKLHVANNGIIMTFWVPPKIFNVVE
jgi:hypothetical protein